MAIRSIKTGLFSRSMLVGNSFYDPGAYHPIATVSAVSGGSANVEFTSIPSTYTHLQIRGILRDTNSSTGFSMIRFNANNVTDSGKYVWHDLTGNGDGNAGAVSVGSSIGQGDTYFRMGRYPLNGQTASSFGALIVDVLDYANTNKNKTFIGLVGSDTNGSGWISLNSAAYLETTAITSIKITAGGTSLAQYSEFSLYGIKVAS